jgi:hypothetical protein
MNSPVLQSAAENQYTIAVHEAGHLIVAVVVGRKLDKVSLDRIDGKRGCFYSDYAKDLFAEILCLLAGPRSQVAVLPDSLSAEKLALFENRIIQPSANPLLPPYETYDFTGWEFDIRPVYQMLALPNAPADGLPFLVTAQKAVERAEIVLKEFFAAGSVRVAVSRVGDSLEALRQVDGRSAVELVRCSGVLKDRALCSLLEWA